MRTTAAIAVLLALVLVGCGGKEDGSVPVPEPAPAPEAAPEASGGEHEEVMKSMIAIFGEHAATLATVKDKATAEAAKPKLQGLALRMQAVQKRVEALGEPSAAVQQRLKEKYEVALSEASQKMVVETMRVAMTPGANEVLADVFAAMQPSGGAKGADTAGSVSVPPPIITMPPPPPTPPTGAKVPEEVPLVR